VGYREFAPPPRLRAYVECGWTSEETSRPVRVLPDGCMDLYVAGDYRFHTSGAMVAGPDTVANLSGPSPERLTGLRFRPGVLPRLLGVPAHELRDRRVRLDEVLGTASHGGSLVGLAAELADEDRASETAPWSMAHLTQITGGLASGATVAELATATGMSSRTLQRRCRAVYGYGPSTLRRVLRFRRAVALMRSGHPLAAVAADAGYSDQPHLHREAREFSGLPLSTLAADQLGRGANTSMDVPSGSVTVA
jgi:AraC-like DNA-binding protein